MALISNTFETAASAGTAITTGNSANGGAGTAFDAVTGAGQTFETTAANKGSLGYQVVAAASTSTFLQWGSTSIAGGTASGAAARFYFNMRTTSRSATHPLLQFRSGGGGTGLLQLQINTAGNLLITSDAAGGATQGTTTGTLSNTTWYRIEMSMSDPTNTTGTATLRVYSGDSTTSISNMDLTLTALNAGSGTAIGMVRIGRPATIGSAITAWMDDVAFQTGSTTLIGPSVSNVAPTANAGTDKTATTGVDLAITATDSDSDGTVVTRAWTVVSSVNGAAPTLTNTSTATVTFNSAAAGSVHTLRYTVTDNGGLTGSDDVIVYVPASVVQPISVTSNTGSWTNVGGAADISAALADTSDSTYAQSPATATNATVRLRLAPLITPSTFSLTVRHQLSSAGTNTSTVTVFEGSTSRKSWTVTPDVTLADTVLSMSSGEIATVTSWNALDIEFSWTAS